MCSNRMKILTLLDSGQYREYPKSDFSDLMSLEELGLVNIIHGEFASNPILHVSLTKLGSMKARQLRNS